MQEVSPRTMAIRQSYERRLLWTSLDHEESRSLARQQRHRQCRTMQYREPVHEPLCSNARKEGSFKGSTTIYRVEVDYG